MGQSRQRGAGMPRAAAAAGAAISGGRLLVAPSLGALVGSGRAAEEPTRNEHGWLVWCDPGRLRGGFDLMLFLGPRGPLYWPLALREVSWNPEMVGMFGLLILQIFADVMMNINR